MLNECTYFIGHYNPLDSKTDCLTAEHYLGPEIYIGDDANCFLKISNKTLSIYKKDKLPDIQAFVSMTWKLLIFIDERGICEATSDRNENCFGIDALATYFSRFSPFIQKTFFLIWSIFPSKAWPWENLFWNPWYQGYSVQYVHYSY